MKIRIPHAEVQEMLAEKNYSYPKYATQVMNLANQNAQGTRPRIVGQMSDLIQEFSGNSMADWEAWYLERHPQAIDNATDKVWAMVEALKGSIVQIDKETVRKWIEELVVVKTFSGLKFQEAILKKVAGSMNTSCRLAVPEEEARGIDGFIGDRPVSIKPHTYKVKDQLPEHIDVPIIFYEKKKAEIVVEFNL